jgi:hypothetical protein
MDDLISKSDSHIVDKWHELYIGAIWYHGS